MTTLQSIKTCSFDGCGRPHKARGLCDGHWQQQHKGQGLRPLRSQTLEGRLWVKVRKTGSCWLWTATTSSGYGQVWVDGRMRLAHRVSWEFINGPIPEGMFLDHRCANKRCVNPSHLRLVTNAQNMQHRTGANKNNTSGIRGVSWNKRASAWAAHANLNGRKYWGGYHSTLEAADQAARALRAKLHTHDDHSEWSQDKEKAA